MTKHVIKSIVLLFVFSHSILLSQDLIWDHETDQTDGFWKLKFSQNDHIIVGHGFGNNLFFDAENGDEIYRMQGNNEIYFVNDDLQFITLNSDEKKFELYDTETFSIIASFEKDDRTIYPIYSVSNDGNYLIAVVQGGIRVWDINTRRILMTKSLLMAEDDLIKFNIPQILYNCDDSQVIIQYDKQYDDKSSTDIIQVTQFAILDAVTLDSVNQFNIGGYFKLSNTCKYYAVKEWDTDYGITIYDFNTNEIVNKLPINGPSLSGLEFSPDDKYIVTSHSIRIWDVITGEVKYLYKSGSAKPIAISNDGNYIFSSIHKYIYMWIARWPGTSVDPIENKNNQIYPNPSTGEFSLKSNLQGNLSIEVYSINGSKLRSFEFTNYGTDITLNLSDLPSGKYSAILQTNNETEVFNLVISK